MHTQIPSSRRQPQPPNYRDLEKNSENPERLLFFFFYIGMTFLLKLLCTKFFFQEISLPVYISAYRMFGFFFFACTVH